MAKNYSAGFGLALCNLDLCIFFIICVSFNRLYSQVYE